MREAELHLLLLLSGLASVSTACTRPSPSSSAGEPANVAVELPVLLYGDFGACAYCAPTGDVCTPAVIDCPADVAAGRVSPFDAQRPPGKEAWVRLREHLIVRNGCSFVPDQYCPQWSAPNARTPACEALPAVPVQCQPVDGEPSVAWQWESLSRFFGGPPVQSPLPQQQPHAPQVREGAAFAAYATGKPVRITASVLPRAGGRCVQYPAFACQPVTIVSPPYAIEGFCPLPEGLPVPCTPMAGASPSASAR